ncbi:MAG: preprotein translocase subunit SecG [Treponema sp.]
MGVVGIILLVAFVVVCVLLVLLVLVQDDGNNGMGGILGGRGTAAFGSHSAGVLTKATAVFVALFFAVAFILAVLNKKTKLEDDLNPTAAVEKTKNAQTPSEKSADKSGEDKKLWWQKASSKPKTTETENGETPDTEIKNVEGSENPASETAQTE